MNIEPWGPYEEVLVDSSQVFSTALSLYTTFYPFSSVRKALIPDLSCSDHPFCRTTRGSAKAAMVSHCPAHQRRNRTCPGRLQAPLSKHGPVLPQSPVSIVGLSFCTNHYRTPKCLFLNILLDTGWGFVGTQTNVRCLFLTFLGGSSVASAIVSSDALTIPSA